ncbi:heme-binding protein [Marivirga arenosa]|nr:heme-binding protein [Marivirga sp. BKB1-2]
MQSQNNIETYQYKVNQKFEDFEIRTYDSSLFTSVKLSGNQYKDMSRKGFRTLASYIFGDNKMNESIAMTSPVSMSLEDSMTMMFLVPKKYSKEDLPQPNNTKIEFRQEPNRKVAAIKFGGWANDRKIKKYREKLMEALDKEGIQYSNHFYFFGYNAPFEVFNRKNEIIVDLNNENEAKESLQ